MLNTPDMHFTHDQHTAKALAIVAFTCILTLLLTGCANRPLEVQGPKQQNTIEGVAKMKSVGLVIGCMFAPNDPECEKIKSKKVDDKPHQTQEEYNEENNKEWNKVN